MKPMSIDLEDDPIPIDIVGTCMLSQNTSFRSSLRKSKENGECIDRTDTKMNRSLHFQETTSILWIEGIDSIPEKEIDDCYYNSRDYICFRDRERRLCRNFSNFGFMKKGRKGDYLGVESRLQRFHRRQRIKNAVFAVLLEQELRIENGRSADSRIEDVLAIARVYQQYTKESTRVAREKADVNSSLVGRTTSTILSKSRTFMNEIEMGSGEEGTHITNKKFELPWEVPVFSKTRLYKNGPADMIKYSTCSYPILPIDYSETLHCKQQSVSQNSPQDYRYLYQNRFDDRGTPVEQKIIRTQEYYKFNNAMFHPQSTQHPVTTGQNYHNIMSQQWNWNQIPCDVGPSANVPTLFRY